MKFSEADKLVKSDGWRFWRASGSHYYYKHPTKQGVVCIPHHKNREIDNTTMKSIKKQAGLI